MSGRRRAPSHKLRKRKRVDVKDEKAFLSVKTGGIACKAKRVEVYQKQKKLKKQLKREARDKRQKEAELLGEDAPPKAKPKTQESTREADETMVAPEDEEVKRDESLDEFAPFFSGESTPKVLITTCKNPTKVSFDFVRDLLKVYSQGFFYERRGYPIKKIVEAATKRGYTEVIVLHEDRKDLNAWTQIHLPAGPTARFRLSSVTLAKDIPNHARPDLSRPEVILNNFNTRLGHRVGRLLGAGFHQLPNFRARRVVTFHNQRDFIFFRHHRYIFNRGEQDVKARLQEIGPRFTLKLQSLQHGTFDTRHGEYEWVHKTEMDTSRRRFFL